jgi:hypothetical protein
MPAFYRAIELLRERPLFQHNSGLSGLLRNFHIF